MKKRIVALCMSLLLSCSLPASGFLKAEAAAALPFVVSAWDYVAYSLMAAVGYKVLTSEDVHNLAMDFTYWLSDQIQQGTEIVGKVGEAAIKQGQEWAADLQAGAVDYYEGILAIPDFMVDVWDYYVGDRFGRYTDKVVTEVDLRIPTSLEDLIYTASNPYTLSYSGDCLDIRGHNRHVDYEISVYGDSPIFVVLTSYASAITGSRNYQYHFCSSSPITYSYVVDGEIRSGTETYHYHTDTNPIYEIGFAFTLRESRLLPIPYQTYVENFSFGIPMDQVGKQQVLDLIYGDLYFSHQTYAVPEVVPGNVVEIPLDTREWTVIEGGQQPNPDGEQQKPSWIPIRIDFPGGENMSPEEFQRWIDEQNQKLTENSDEYVNNLFPDQGVDPNPEPGVDPEPGTDPGSGENPDPSDLSLPEMVMSKFPFCIPFDLSKLIGVFEADPVAPLLELPVKFHFGSVNYDYTFTIDFSDFDMVARVFRVFETLLFLSGLLVVTRNLIRG